MTGSTLARYPTRQCRLFAIGGRGEGTGNDRVGLAQGLEQIIYQVVRVLLYPVLITTIACLVWCWWSSAGWATRSTCAGDIAL